MRDVDYPDALRFQSSNRVEEYFGLLVRQRGRRLVHDQNISLDRKSFRDLDHLLLSYAKFTDQSIRVEVEAKTFQQLASFGGFGVALDETHDVALTPKENIFGDREVRYETKLLMNDADAVSLRVRDILHYVGVAFDDDFAFFWDINSCENFYEGGFACAVFAKQRVNFSGL